MIYFNSYYSWYSKSEHFEHRFSIISTLVNFSKPVFHWKILKRTKLREIGKQFYKVGNRFFKIEKTWQGFLHTRMSKSVPLEIPLVMESCRTLIACKGPHIRMRSHVSVQRILVLKAFSTMTAHVGSLTCMFFNKQE